MLVPPIDDGELSPLSSPPATTRSRRLEAAVVLPAGRAAAPVSQGSSIRRELRWVGANCSQ